MFHPSSSRSHLITPILRKVGKRSETLGKARAIPELSSIGAVVVETASILEINE
jgi:hypothetical protein